ncbi:MAG: VirB3 family type IV secretion system protein [Succinivibrio sp.]|jgi:type IV secretory pathway TrbD component|nr:VirB3 family type IV secretion system protein [Succinivibrio sp.]
MEKAKIYRSLLRKPQFFGCERDLSMTLALLCGVIGFAGGLPWGAVAGGGCFFAGILWLRALSGGDPFWTRVYWRSLKLRARYQAATPLFANDQRKK